LAPASNFFVFKVIQLYVWAALSKSVAVARKSCMSCNHAWLSVNETSKTDTATTVFVLLKDNCVLFVRSVVVLRLPKYRYLPLQNPTQVRG
jgi:hypothetical protein